ncbi:MAG TPA: hypothetical protein VMZ91_00605 [Candidatus Paceibacterota bacterium]|nr:hypothetical protein [Candidatus Paceibacterota bacterium]
MAKKKKKERSEWMKNRVNEELKEMREGKFLLDKQHKIRYKKTRIPKWLDKFNEYGKSSHINFRQKFGRWANNEERIVMEIFVGSDIDLKSIAKKTKIDYKNISRYLKELEKKDLVKIESEFKFKKMPSGKYKKWHPKRVKLTNKGEKKRKDYLGF